MPPATNKVDLPPTRRACGNCGMLGHLATTCRRAAKAHIKVGVEVEGYWRREGWEAVERAAENWHMSGTEDGSLNSHAGFVDYEWRTRPGSLGEAINQVVAVYPDATDPACGMHVHVSFQSGDVTALASEEFFTYFREQWEAWGRKMEINESSQFWARLRGTNSYCRPPTITTWRGMATPVESPSREIRPYDSADEHIQAVADLNGLCDEGSCAECDGNRNDILARYAPGGRYDVSGLPAVPAPRRVVPTVLSQTNRYLQLNFLAYEAHGTVECRLLPLFQSARLAVSAMEHLLWIYESFLAEADERVFSKAARTVRKVPSAFAPVRATRTGRVEYTAPEQPQPRITSVDLDVPEPTFGTLIPRTLVARHLEAQGVL